MARIVWTMKAANEYEAAVDYVARRAPIAARRLAQRIMRRVRSLRRHPNSGGFVLEDPHRRFRELIEGNYRIIYRHDRNAVAILSIHHGARLLRIEELQ